MFLDRLSESFFESELKKSHSHLESHLENQIEYKYTYLNTKFKGDIEYLISCFEEKCFYDEENSRKITERLYQNYFKDIPVRELIDHPLFQLFMAYKMGFTKMNSVISFKEICDREGISKQQLDQSTYNLLDNPGDNIRKHKLPAIKLRRYSFAFMRDYQYWSVTRIRRKR
ncbi:hypothetical protein A8L34_27970 [Bacillus sp. FJAT-27264]|uniref:hypothetical protein n=1 Tax=Paenibacillus sp. (strain DSM 101736 / FJAT-27264) TaxID=1850362 RepID=UPI00080802E8|nr:hypothetical protein [Bacillus sp. FJAT-27264]OBZ15886.1 hypothetical protein A8L34_27970 [Bacillus sp. FJAT-27264]